MSTKVNGNPTPGDYVTYSDMANPGSTVKVMRQSAPWAFVMEWDFVRADGTWGASDMRQAGWTFATEAEIADYEEQV